MNTSHSVACLVLVFLIPGWVSAENVSYRGNLNNSRAKFERTGKGHVAFIGGSITEMNGYRPMVSEMLQKRFPKTKFTFTNAGISSTCSTTGAFRLGTHVLNTKAAKKEPVDLFFIEFAVNDNSDAKHARRECIRGLEGIIRHARRNNPKMDIVVTYFVTPRMLRTFQSGKTPMTVESHEAVAEHYDISTIHLGRQVADLIADKKLTWKQFGGTHPAPHGNRICANMIGLLFDRAWSKPLASSEEVAAHRLPEKRLDELSYDNGRFIAPAKAKVISGWKLAVPDWKNLKGSKRSRFTSIAMLSADAAGAELTLEFDGTAVGVYVVAGPDAGFLEASVDGGPTRQVNLFHHFSRGLHYPRTVMLGTDLAKGKHTLRVRVSEQSTSTGHAARIIQFVAN